MLKNIGPIEGDASVDHMPPTLKDVGPMKRNENSRITRELSMAEAEVLDAARRDVATHSEDLLDEARQAKQVWLSMQQVLANLLDQLKAERERQELSLADIEDRSGLKRSALSRLENDPRANPTLLTLQRYASALGMTLSCDLQGSDVVQSP